MTLQEFWKHKKLVNAAAKLARDPMLQMAMSIIWEEHPMHRAPHMPMRVNNTDYQLGAIDGANWVIWVLQHLDKPVTTFTEPKAEYKPPIE